LSTVIVGERPPAAFQRFLAPAVVEQDLRQAAIQCRAVRPRVVVPTQQVKTNVEFSRIQRREERGRGRT
jgi:hypothetical protein